ALAVLTTIESGGLLANAAAAGKQLADGIGAISHPLLAGVRGQGLWLAALLTGPAAAALEAAGRPARLPGPPAPRGGLPGHPGPAGRDPAGPAAHHPRRSGRRVPGRAGRHPRRRRRPG